MFTLHVCEAHYLWGIIRSLFPPQQGFILCLKWFTLYTDTFKCLNNFSMHFYLFQLLSRCHKHTYFKALPSTVQHVFPVVPCRWSPPKLPFPYQLLVHGHKASFDTWINHFRLEWFKPNVYLNIGQTKFCKVGCE